MALAFSVGACARIDRQASERKSAAEQHAYAAAVAGQLSDCITVEGQARRSDPGAAVPIAPAIAKICSCYREGDFSEPQLHTLRIAVDASGTIRSVRDSAYADASQFGGCPALSLRGLAMPRPPGATILDIRLADLLVSP